MPEESQVESSEYQDDADIHHSSSPESVSEERDIHTDYNGCHHDTVKHASYVFVHFSTLRLRRCPIFLVRATHDDGKRIVQRRSLQRLRFIPRGAHPDITFLLRGQDHRHRLRMDWLDHGVRRGRQESVDLMRTRHRL